MNKPLTRPARLAGVKIMKEMQIEEIKKLKFSEDYFSNETWHPDETGFYIMGSAEYEKAIKEYKDKEAIVLFEGFRVVFDTCDCGGEWGCRHGTYPYEIKNEFDKVSMEWEDDGFFIDAPKGLVRFEKVENMTMGDFIDACSLLNIQLKYVTHEHTI